MPFLTISYYTFILQIRVFIKKEEYFEHIYRNKGAINWINSPTLHIFNSPNSKPPI